MHFCTDELVVVAMTLPFVRWAFEYCRGCWHAWLCRDKAHHEKKPAVPSKFLHNHDEHNHDEENR